MLAIDAKVIFSVLAMTSATAAFLPYIRGVLLGTIKPHVLTWIIWSTTTFIIFAVQLSENAGVGAWATGFSAALAITIALLAFFKKGDIAIILADWLFFIAALASLPFWYFTSDPVWAVIVLTLVDFMGFGPTIRKAYSFPHDEGVMFFLLFAVSNVFIILALESYSVSTVLFPLMMSLACCFLSVMIMYRRAIVRNSIAQDFIVQDSTNARSIT